METTQNKPEAGIATARITDYPKNFLDPMPEVIVTFEGDKTEVKLFSFYPDEIDFLPSEFIGLTAEEARNLKFRKDKQYLQS